MNRQKGAGHHCPFVAILLSKLGSNENGGPRALPVVRWTQRDEQTETDDSTFDRSPEYFPMSGSLAEDAQAKLEGSNVLVVEDESMIAMLIEEMLLDLGCGSIWLASNMEEAQAILKDNRPHLAVLDVHLGGDSGYRLAGELA